MSYLSRYILDDNHQPQEVGAKAWRDFFGESSNWRVGLTIIGGSEVSTVFLRSPMDFDDEALLFFETKVFGGPLDEQERRYATWDEAVPSHADMVEKVTNAGR